MNMMVSSLAIATPISGKEREAYSKTLETTVYLAPEACHKGIGPLLMTHLIDECRRQGYHALIACITADNLSSLRFH